MEWPTYPKQASSEAMSSVQDKKRNKKQQLHLREMISHFNSMFVKRNQGFSEKMGY